MPKRTYISSVLIRTARSHAFRAALVAFLLAACASRQSEENAKGAGAALAARECANSRPEQRLNFDLAGPPPGLDAFAGDATKLAFKVEFGCRWPISSGAVVVMFAPANDPWRVVAQLSTLADKHGLVMKGPLIFPPACSQRPQR